MRPVAIGDIDPAPRTLGAGPLLAWAVVIGAAVWIAVGTLTLKPRRG